MEGGHGNSCRFATLTGGHQGARICLANNGLLESSELEQNYGICYRKNRDVEVLPVVGLIAYDSICFLLNSGNCNTCNLTAK